MEIIDTHAWYACRTECDIPSGTGHLRELKQRYAPQHQLKFIAVSASHETNRCIADTVRDNADLFIGAHLQIVPKHGTWAQHTPIGELATLAQRPEIVGFKIHTSLLDLPVDSPLLDPYFQLAGEIGAPVLMHCCASGRDYTSPKQLRRMMERHPYLIPIFAHFGGLNLEYVPETLALMREFPQVRLNTTGMSGELRRYSVKDGTPHVVAYSPLLPQAENPWSAVLQKSMGEEGIASRILFGSDTPFLTHTLSPIDELPLADQERLMANARTLFRRSL